MQVAEYSAQMKHKSKPAKAHQKYILSMTTRILLLKTSPKLSYYIQKAVQQCCHQFNNIHIIKIIIWHISKLYIAKSSIYQKREKSTVQITFFPPRSCSDFL